jgi:hypothetical protein
MNILGRSLSKRELERRTGNLQQIGGTRHFEYSGGRAREVLEVEPGSDLSRADHRSDLRRKL